MADIQCKTEIPPISGLTDNELTVGREFLLVCEGAVPRFTETDKLQFVLKPENKYMLKLLAFELRSPTQADLKVTTYQAGSLTFEDLMLTDGQQTAHLGPLALKVQSVLPQPEQGKPQQKVEPIGPLGPVTMPIPGIYWLVLAGVVGFFGLLGAFKLVLRIQRRRMLAQLREHDSAMTPLSQFHQSFRRLQRSNSVFFGSAVEPGHIVQCFDDVQSMFRLFLTRRFQVPAFKWSDRLILKDIKKYHPKVFAEYAEEMQKIFKELNHGAKDRTKLSQTDVVNIATHTRVLVEKLERVP